MGRTTERLTVDHLEEIGECGRCVFWELDPVRRSKAAGHEAEEKSAWVSTVLREWGSCGRVVVVDGAVVGHVLWAPPVHVPGADGFATAPISGDAVVMTEMHVAPEHRGGGLGRMLVQGMAKDLVKRGGIKAVETFGETREHEDSCVVPADFLLSVGFSTVRPHASNPRMRMDLRTTLSLREELEKGLERLLSPVSGKRAAPAVPQRATRAGRQES